MIVLELEWLTSPARPDRLARGAVRVGHPSSSISSPWRGKATAIGFGGTVDYAG